MFVVQHNCTFGKHLKEDTIPASPIHDSDFSFSSDESNTRDSPDSSGYNDDQKEGEGERRRC